MVSFELGKGIEEKFFSSCHERGTKKKSWVLMRNRTSDLRIPGSDALATEPQRLHGERGESHESRFVNFLYSPPLSTLSATTDPPSVPWKPCHPLKSPNPFSLKINNDRCGPLDTILRGQFYWSYTRKIITWVARTFCDLYAHLEYAERLFKNKTFKKSLLRS